VSLKARGVAVKWAAICFEVVVLVAATIAVGLEGGILRTSAATLVFGYVLRTTSGSIREWSRL
jgi:hypothetical protein